MWPLVASQLIVMVIVIVIDIVIVIVIVIADSFWHSFGNFMHSFFVVQSSRTPSFLNTTPIRLLGKAHVLLGCNNVALSGEASHGKEHHAHEVQQAS